MSTVYKKLPTRILKDVVGNEPQLSEHGDAKTTTEEFFKEIISQKHSIEDWSNLYCSLEKWPRVQESNQFNKKQRLNYKEKRQLNLNKIKGSNLKYEDFIPMHDMWLSYIKNLLDLRPSRIPNPVDMKSALLKADYHGCRILVSRSKNPALVGVTGIVIRETKNCFLCITKENKIKNIPKQNSVFNFQFDKYLFTLYGNQFKYKTTDRKLKLFKSKGTIDLK